MVNPLDLRTILLAKQAQHVVLNHFPRGTLATLDSNPTPHEALPNERAIRTALLLGPCRLSGRKRQIIAKME